jgi:two-component system sensor histidine kinase UhpB
MSEQGSEEKLESRLRQFNEQLLISALDARDSADRANAALALLQAVIRQMPAGVIIADAASREIILSNERARKLFPECSSVSELARYFETHYFHPDGSPCSEDEFPMSRIIRTGKEVRHQEIRFEHADDGPGVINMDSAAVRDTKGDLIAAILTCEDITEQKRLVEREHSALLKWREVSAKLQAVREEERTRIAREIHDELGQAMSGLYFDLAWLLKQMGAGRRIIREKIQSMIETSQQAIQSVRRIASELRPSVLDDLGLVAALEWQISEFQKRTGINCQLKCPPELALDQERSTAVFRMIQEALTNVMRHAEATRVKVILKTHDHSLKIQIADNGRGISADEIARESSLGITGMNERAVRLGGDFKIGAGSRGGTQVNISLPTEARRDPS